MSARVAVASTPSPVADAIRQPRKFHVRCRTTKTAQSYETVSSKITRNATSDGIITDTREGSARFPLADAGDQTTLQFVLARRCEKPATARNDKTSAVNPFASTAMYPIREEEPEAEQPTSRPVGIAVDQSFAVSGGNNMSSPRLPLHERKAQRLRHGVPVPR